MLGPPRFLLERPKTAEPHLRLTDLCCEDLIVGSPKSALSCKELHSTLLPSGFRVGLAPVSSKGCQEGRLLS